MCGFSCSGHNKDSLSITRVALSSILVCTQMLQPVLQSLICLIKMESVFWSEVWDGGV